jgi:hypothetical protein
MLLRDAQQCEGGGPGYTLEDVLGGLEHHPQAAAAAALTALYKCHEDHKAVVMREVGLQAWLGYHIELPCLGGDF